MENSESKQQSSFDFDEKGTAEVSEQIMKSYNSGFINKEGRKEELKHSEENK